MRMATKHHARLLATRARPPRVGRASIRKGESQIIEAWAEAKNKKLGEKAATNLCDSTLKSLPSLNKQQLPALVSAVSNSNVGCGPPWDGVWRGMAEAAVPLLGKVSGSGLTTIAHEYATVGYRPRGLFDGIANAATPRIADGAFSPFEVASIAHAFAFTAHPAPELHQAACTWSASRLDDYKPIEIGTLAWASAAADVPSPDLFASDAFADRMALLGDDKKLGDAALSMLHQWVLWCDERGFSAQDALPLPDPLKARCRAAFGRGHPRPSLLQMEVAAAFERIGEDVTIEHEVELPESGYQIDLVVTYDGLKVAVEVDGPSHFLGDSEQPNGATLLKRRQLRHLGWTLLPVPYFEFVQGDRYVDVYAALNLREALDRLTGPTHRAYRLLQLDPAKASFDDAKAAYHRSLLQNHPDRNPGDKAAEERTAEVIDAYSIIQSANATGGWQREQREAAAEAAARERSVDVDVGSSGDAQSEEEMMAWLRGEARRYKREKLLEEEEAERVARQAKRQREQRKAARAEAAERAEQRAAERAALAAAKALHAELPHATFKECEAAVAASSNDLKVAKAALLAEKGEMWEAARREREAAEAAEIARKEAEEEEMRAAAMEMEEQFMKDTEASFATETQQLALELIFSGRPNADGLLFYRSGELRSSYLTLRKEGREETIQGPDDLNALIALSEAVRVPLGIGALSCAVAPLSDETWVLLSRRKLRPFPRAFLVSIGVAALLFSDRWRRKDEPGDSSGSSSSEPGDSSSSSSSSSSSTQSLAPFVAADCFEGARDGYVFKMDADGLGYYRDEKQAAPHRWENVPFARYLVPPTTPADLGQDGSDKYVKGRAAVHAAIFGSVGYIFASPDRLQEMASKLDDKSLQKSVLKLRQTHVAIWGAILGTAVALAEGQFAQWLVRKSQQEPPPRPES